MTPQVNQLKQFLLRKDNDIEYDDYNRKLKATTLFVSDKNDPFNKYFYLEVPGNERSVRASYLLEGMSEEATIVVDIVVHHKSRIELCIRSMNNFKIIYEIEED